MLNFPYSRPKQNTTPRPDHNFHTAEPDDALPPISMDELPAQLRQAAERAGWTSLMPVQSKAIPYLLAGRDLMVQSRTGSGKTGAFILPILKKIDPSRPVCQALVLVPTRELAMQVARDAKTLAGDTGARTVPVYGGVSYGPQIEGFQKGAHLVVGTPGRILDHLLKKTLSLEKLDTLVFDEADRMLSMGFYPDMKRLQGFLPKRKISGCMFSATFPSRVMRLAGEFLRRPEMLSLSRDHVHIMDVEHAYCVVPAMKKDRCLVKFIELENPDSALIFCNRKSDVHYVTVVLQRFGYDADELSADLSQSKREQVMARVRKGALRFLVATDVAARGIDIPELSHVFQYAPPEDNEMYIHRAGRTGRAGAGGVAIMLVSGVEKFKLDEIAKQYNITMQERKLPTDEDVEAIVSQRTTALLEARLRGLDRLHAERMQRFLPLARQLAQNEDESPVIAMVLDDYYQQTLHAPPPPPVRETSRKTADEGKGSSPRRRQSKPRRSH